jgi:hypothetical protein
MKKLERPRAPLSPPQFTVNNFWKLKRANAKATSESGIMTNVLPSGQNQVFNHLEPLTPAIVDAQPDYYDGTRPTTTRQKVRDELRPYIIPCQRKSKDLAERSIQPADLAMKSGNT